MTKQIGSAFVVDEDQGRGAEKEYPSLDSLLFFEAKWHGDNPTDLLTAIHAGQVAYLAPKRLDVSTLLTERQLQDHGLHLAGGDGAHRWLIPVDLQESEQPGPRREQHWFADLRRRVEELGSIAQDEALEFNEASADQALNFAMKVQGCSRPSAFLIGNGNVRLLWTHPSGQQIGLQFLGDDEIQFILVARRDEKLATTMGADRADAVLRYIAAAGLSRLLAH
jgi:hypothetical protein